jgi:hypothetical protein
MCCCLGRMLFDRRLEERGSRAVGQRGDTTDAGREIVVESLASDEYQSLFLSRRDRHVDR